MNSSLTTVLSRHDHPPIQTQSHPVRRVGTLDRIALHLGVALIKWGRRPQVVESRERRANRYEQQLARLERERHYERNAGLTLPPR